MVKRGQAAMEFLMTYGWAILVVLIAIGALAYFGVLSPGRFLPQSCTLAPGFACADFTVDNVADNDTTIIVRNGVGAGATGVTFTVNQQGAGLCTSGAGNPTTIAEGADAIFQWNCPGIDAASTQGTRFKATLTLTYTLSGQSLPHTVTGDMTTRIE